jgi:wyosine [tRNA(Phe)-imidazoG37] synthetase (radical SAM superfamily)
MDRYPIPNPTVIAKVLREPIPPAPLTAMIHIAEHCNVRCEFCWHHSFLRKETLKPVKVETAEVLTLIEHLEAMGTKDITLSANGEPTIHPGFSEIVNKIKNAGMKLKVVTNLTVFTPPVAAALGRTDHLIVNLAAWDEDSYKAIYAPRGQMSFADIIKNIKSLTELNNGPKIKIGYVITKNNFRQIAEALNIASSSRVDSVRFKFIDPSDFTESLVLNNTDRSEMTPLVKELLKTPSTIQNNLADILKVLPGARLGEDEALPEHGRCFVGWFVININEDGTVTLCCQNEELVIGNWREKPLQEIWNGQTAREFRNSAKTKIAFNHPTWHACRTCYYSDPKHYSRRMNW